MRNNKKPAGEPQARKNKQTVTDVSGALRATQALQLRAQGLTYEEIAIRTGYASRGAAHNAVQRALAQYSAPIIEDARKLEEFRLDMLLGSVWPLCFEHEKVTIDKNGNEKREKKLVDLFAIDRALAIAERRARLRGLDMPKDEAAGNAVVIREVPAGLLPLRIVESGNKSA